MTPQQHVEQVVEKCLSVFPSDGDRHVDTFMDMIFNGHMSKEMADILSHIIENPNCVYVIKKDGTLKVLD